MYPLGQKDLQKTIFNALEKYRLHDSEITFLYCFKEIHYSYTFHPMSFPNKEQIPKIKLEVEKEMQDDCEKFFNTSSKNWKYRCKFGTHELSNVLDFIYKDSSDLIICAVKKRSLLGNVFHSSFTKAMINHADKNILVVKQGGKFE